MKNIVGILIVVTFLQSCSKNNINSDLLGNWESTKSANVVELEFFKDSLISNAWEKTTKFSWKSDSSKIYYTQLTNINPELETDFIMEYRLNSRKDTLYIKNLYSDFTNEFVRNN
ncbi:hypothetical protein AAT17_04500 [Nonlabens sp. MIC269]|uniref:hypothetical protein n=1 Tax=Nonlabens sp. MIC269 TaxID=1476901 RepID=UPI000722EC80|nr:hypothetical protein [Nonlabens sp. MIC269]ALM20547.1 hypothetical protein AAT17_04500 [Nonlabens sp. MIC269]